MSGETEDRPSGWTTDTLLAHLNRVIREMDLRYEGRYTSTLGSVREMMSLQKDALTARIDGVERSLQAALIAQREAVSAALASQQRAVDLAEQMAQRWRDQANEWRAAMMDRDKLFATASVVEALDKRLDKLEQSRDEQSGAWKYLTAFVGLAVGLIVIVSTVIIIVSR